MASEVMEGLKIENRMTFPPEAAGAKIRLHGRDYDIPVTDTVFSKHILINGAIGFGKTTCLRDILGQVISGMGEKDVAVVFDTKGEFKEEFYRPGKDAVISNDYSATVRWNAFREVEIDGPEKLEQNLHELVHELYDEKIRRSNAPFFPTAGRDVLYGIMTYIEQRVEKAGRNNAELYHFLNEAQNADIINSFNEILDLNGLIDYISGSTEQSQGVYSELRAVTNEILLGNFREKGEFSIRDFVRKKGGRVLYIEYDLSVGATMAPIYKTLLDLAIKETLSRGRSDGNVYFFIDEFALLPHLCHITDGVNFGRSLGARFVVAIQNCDQVVAAYGQENAASILSAFNTLITFRVTDRRTMEFVREHYGSARKILTYAGRDYTKGPHEQPYLGSAVEDWDILSLPVGTAIVSVADYGPNPVKFRFRG